MEERVVVMCISEASDLSMPPGVIHGLVHSLFGQEVYYILYTSLSNSENPLLSRFESRPKCNSNSTTFFICTMTYISSPRYIRKNDYLSLTKQNRCIADWLSLEMLNWNLCSGPVSKGCSLSWADLVVGSDELRVYVFCMRWSELVDGVWWLRCLMVELFDWSIRLAGAILSMAEVFCSLTCSACWWTCFANIQLSG